MGSYEQGSFFEAIFACVNNTTGLVWCLESEVTNV